MISNIQKALARNKLDAILISQPDNRRYLSGYTAHDTSINESSGFLLLFRNHNPILLTDFRFQQQAEIEAKDFEVKIYKKGLYQILPQIIQKRNVKSLAYEAHYFLVSHQEKLQKLSQKFNFRLASKVGFVEKFRLTKNKNEIDLIRRSVRLNETVFQDVFQNISEGQTEIEVAIMIENLMRKLGAERPSFDTIVASGPNAAMPHAVPSNRIIKANEPIIIDMGLVLEGYCSDMTRTIVLGTPSSKTVNLFRLVRKAQNTATQILKPGLLCCDADRAARNIIKKAGYGPQFGHALGHGVGLAVHEAPSLSKHCRKKLQQGMVVTVEPGIYIPGWGGIRLENMAVITKDSHSILNTDTTFLDL